MRAIDRAIAVFLGPVAISKIESISLRWRLNFCKHLNYVLEDDTLMFNFDVVFDNGEYDLIAELWSGGDHVMIWYEPETEESCMYLATAKEGEGSYITYNPEHQRLVLEHYKLE